jgi:transposase
MRFVPVKSEGRQAVPMMHRARDLPVRQRTQPVNAARGHLAEFGVVGPQGLWNVSTPLDEMRRDGAVPELAREVLELLAAQLDAVDRRIAEVEAKIKAWHKSDSVGVRLATIPGIGPLVASAVAATVAHPSASRSGREFSAWLGLVPRQRSTGGKRRLGRISRQGDGYVRRLPIIGAQTVLLRSKAAKADPWIRGMLARAPRLKVAVALANKTARIAWAVMTRDEPHRSAARA